MADDPANEGAAPPHDEAAEQDDARGEPAPLADTSAGERRVSPVPGSMSSWSARRRTLLVSLAFLVPSAVIALGVTLIMRGGAPRVATVAMNSAEPVHDAAPTAPASGASESAPPLDKAEPAAAAFVDEEGSDDQPAPTKRVAPKHFATVQQAAAGSCSTESVAGLSRQIIDQARCIEPNAFVPLPKRSNLVLSAHVFPYLEQAAREHLVRALDTHSAQMMTINSALRTVAQQYLVWRWAASKSCGVQLATPPGESNHEIGFALDIAEAAKWRPALEAQEFHWLGSSDRVHFDFKGASAPPHSATDVLAFQKLWNKNHRADSITEDGHYSPATEQRLKRAPTAGFPLGPSCGSTARKH